MSSNSTTFFPLPSSEVGGSVAVNIFAVLSTFAIFTVVIRVAWLACWPLVQKSETSSPPREFVFFRTQLGLYAACLLFADLLSNLSGLINLVWLYQRGITEGSLCNIQAITMQIANVAAAYFTVTISMHTFITLVLRKRQSIIVGATFITIGWLLSIGIAVIPLVVPDMYGVSGISCGIRPRYATALFFYHLFPIFLAALFCAVLYALIFLILRGNLVLRGGLSLRLDPQERWGGRDSPLEDYHHFVTGIAKSLILFPIAYVVLLVPYSVTRLFILSGYAVSFQALVVASICWFMIGVVNVVLLYNTFRVVSPVMDLRKSVPSKQGEESFASWQHLGFGNKGSLDVEKNISTSSYGSQEFHSANGHKPMSASVSQMSTRDLAYAHSRNASDVSSYYVGRAISPVSQLNRNISFQSRDVPAPPRAVVAQRSIYRTPSHTRNGSTDSMGLTAAPRYTRSEVARGQESRAARPQPSPVATGAPLSRSGSRRTTTPMPRDSFGAPTTPNSAGSSGSQSYVRSSYFETYYGLNTGRSLTRTISPTTPTSAQRSPVERTKRENHAL